MLLKGYNFARMMGVCRFARMMGLGWLEVCSYTREKVLDWLLKVFNFALVNIGYCACSEVGRGMPSDTWAVGGLD